MITTLTHAAVNEVDLNRATQRRYDAGLELRDVRRAAMANPHNPCNPELMAAAAAHVAAAQAELDALQSQEADVATPGRTPAFDV